MNRRLSMMVMAMVLVGVAGADEAPISGVATRHEGDKEVADLVKVVLER